jgi:predicted ATPase
MALGSSNVHSLVDVIPSLKSLFGTFEGESIEDEKMHGCSYLLCQLTKVLSHLFPLPIILFLDDLQWADKRSILLIKQAFVFPWLSPRRK